MARPMKPLVRGGGYYPSSRWTPLVYPGGYTTANGNGAEPTPLIKTVKGAIAHVTDALAMPAIGLKCEINPLQAGTGDPSPTNIRPISGWTGCNIHVSRTMSGGTVYPITFPDSAGTVYGGTLDVVNGVLKVTHAITTVSAKTWRYESNYTRFNAGFAGMVSGKYGVRTVPFMCSAFQPIDDGRSLASVPNNSIYGAGTSATVFIKTDTVSTVEDFISTYGNVQILYELESPIDITISPTEVTTLLGTNNIWHDANGDTELTYYAE